jgi:hypothetical protein
LSIPRLRRKRSAEGRAGTPHPSPGCPVFRWGDALVNRSPVRRRPPAALRPEAVVPDHRGRTVELLLLEGHRIPAFSRDAADVALAGWIRVSNTASDGTYGAPRVTADLREAGERVNRKRVTRVMRRFGVQGLRLRRPPRPPSAIRLQRRPRT